MNGEAGPRDGDDFGPDELGSDEVVFDEVDCAPIFDADYLAFYREDLAIVTSDEEAELILMLCNLEAGERVLDLPCGHGRIARRLAGNGARVVGVDSSEVFLERARTDLLQHGVSVDYRHGDMRTIEFEQEFDVVLNWFTSFGYSADATLKDILRRMWRALVPGGRLLLETMNVHDVGLTASSSTTCKEIVADGESRLMVDKGRYDPHDGRLYVRRLVTGQGPTRALRYFIRLFSLPELRSWLHEAGFVNVHAFGGDGEVFRVDSGRLIVTAQRP